MTTRWCQIPPAGPLNAILQVQKYAKRHHSRSSCYLKPPARCRKAAEVEIWIFLLPPITARLCSLSAMPLGMKKTPQDSHWDSHLRPQSPSPAAAAASCTGASRIDRSDISLHPPAAAGEGALLCFRGRMTKGRAGRVTGKAARTEESFHARVWT